MFGAVFEAQGLPLMSFSAPLGLPMLDRLSLHFCGMIAVTSNSNLAILLDESLQSQRVCAAMERSQGWFEFNGDNNFQAKGV